MSPPRGLAAFIAVVAVLASTAAAGAGGGGAGVEGWVRLAYRGGGLAVYEALVPAAGGVVASSYGPGVAVGGVLVTPSLVVDLGLPCPPAALAASPDGLEAFAAAACSGGDGLEAYFAWAGPWGSVAARGPVLGGGGLLVAAATYRAGGFYALLSTGSSSAYASANPVFGVRVWGIDAPRFMTGDASPLPPPPGLHGGPYALAASTPSGDAVYTGPGGGLVYVPYAGGWVEGFGACGAAPAGGVACSRREGVLAANGWARVYELRVGVRVASVEGGLSADLPGHAPPLGLAGPYLVAARAGGGWVDVVYLNGTTVYSIPVEGGVEVYSPTGLTVYVVERLGEASRVYIIHYEAGAGAWGAGGRLIPLALAPNGSYYLSDGGVERIEWTPELGEPPPPGALASLLQPAEAGWGPGEPVRLTPAGYWLAYLNSTQPGWVDEFILIHAGGYTVFTRVEGAVYAYNTPFEPALAEAVAVEARDSPPFPYRALDAPVEAVNPIPAVLELQVESVDARVGGVEPRRARLAAILSPAPLPGYYTATFTCTDAATGVESSVSLTAPPGAVLHTAPLPPGCRDGGQVNASLPLLGSPPGEMPAITMRFTAQLGLAESHGGGYVLSSLGSPVEAGLYVAEGPGGAVTGSGAVELPWGWGRVRVEAWDVRLAASSGGAPVTLTIPHLAVEVDLGPPPQEAPEPPRPAVEVPWWLATGGAAALGVLAACALLWRYSRS